MGSADLDVVPPPSTARTILSKEGPSLVYFGEDEVLVSSSGEKLLEDSKDYKEDERENQTKEA